jgi:hypothetical protein
LLILTYDGWVHKYTPDGAVVSGSFFLGSGNAWCIAVPDLRINTKDGQFGIATNGFAFNVSGSADQTVTIEGCTNPATSFWVPLQTNTLGFGPLYFADSDWTSFAQRYYRVSGH